MLPPRQKRIYDGCLMLSPEGVEMCRINEKRARWYIRRGLAEQVGEDPITIRLLFEPAGKGHEGDEFYTTAREDICVGCGSTEDLTRHHVVPRWYRRHMPDDIKSHASHDLVALCVPCHDRYERAAMDLKQRLAEEYDAPFASGGAYDPEIGKAKKAAAALLRLHADPDLPIPAERVEVLREAVRAFLGTTEIAAMERLCDRSTWVEDGTPDHGALVVAAIDDLQAFVERWRRHFVETVKPKHLPHAWTVDRPIDT